MTIAVYANVLFVVVVLLLASKSASAGKSESEVEVLASGRALGGLEYRKSVETMHAGPSTKLVPLAQRTRASVFDVHIVGQLFEGKYKMQWAGQPLQKDAVSLALYTTLLHQLRPGTIFDLGTFGGGSALWFGAQARAMGLTETKVVTFDIEDLRPDDSKQRMEASGNIAFIQGDLFDVSN